MHPASSHEQNRQLSQYHRIGLFDSGVGGLSVLKQLVNLPGQDDRSFVYLADTARCPYGNRHPDEINQFVSQIVSWLQEQKVDAIVMACNTSAALAYETALAAATVPVFDLISSAARYAASLSNRVAVMATASTAKSQAFSKTIHASSAQASVFEYGCPDLVPLVESGRADSDEATLALTRYVSMLQADAADALILGCTHFPFLRKRLAQLLPERITLIDPACVLAGATADGNTLINSCEFFVTGDPSGFSQTAEVCLGYIPQRVRSITIDELLAYNTLRRLAIAADTIASPAVPGVVQ